MQSIKESEPSLFTDENKNYVSGGTTPDSNIIINKTTPNYFKYGALAVIVGFIGYKLFFEKK